MQFIHFDKFLNGLISRCYYVFKIQTKDKMPKNWAAGKELEIDTALSKI